MPIDRFSKNEFEVAIKGYKFSKEVKDLGLQNDQSVYLINFGSPHIGLLIFSSIDHTGFARDNGEDSIRACLADITGETPKILPGKVQSYVTRQKNWRDNLKNMLVQLAKLARWIQPCPTCQQLLKLAIKRADKEVFLFCEEDSKNRHNPNHERHLPLTVLDFHTGEELRSITPEISKERTCPTCQTPLIRVRINRGANTGKHAWTCPKKEKGRYLNHLFEVETEGEQDE